MTKDASPTIELRGVSKGYGALRALEPTTLRLGPGVNVLLGPSGSGKSTLLRLVAGLARPGTGEVAVGGQVVSPETIGALRRRIGYVIQEGGLFPHMTAGANVALPARQAGWSPRWIDGRLDELCELTSFPRDGLARFPVQLSGGQRQRVSLMRALMLEPSLLLLDEPLGALDPMIRAELRRDLLRIFRTLESTVLLVTHDLAEAEHFADVVILMRDGRIVQAGTMRDLVERPAEPFVSHFIGAQSLRGPGA